MKWCAAGPYRLRSGLSCQFPTRKVSALLGPIVLAAVFLLILPCSVVVANDTAVGGIGGNVYPLSNADIRMEAETVQAVCYRGFAEYRIEFRFVNEGPAQKVKLGFPFRVTVPDSMGSPPIAFRAWQDGEPLPVWLGRGVSQQDLIDGGDSLGYYLHEAVFAPGETTIVVAYFARPTVSSGGRFPQLSPPEATALNISAWSARYDYWVHTGAGWKGRIDKTVVRFYLADDFMGWGVDVPSSLEGARADNTTGPEPYTRADARTYQWVYEDYEPTEEHDVQLAFDRPNFFWFGGAAAAIPAAWGIMPVMAGRSDEWWQDESTRPVGWEAIDSDPSTAWDYSGAKGNSMRMTIVGDHKIEEVRIIAGRNDSFGAFEDYGRPRSVRIILSDGTRKVVNLADSQGLQRFPLSGTADWVRVEVLDSYPGAKSDRSFMSEIAFGTEPAPAFVDFATLMREQVPSATEPPAPAGSTTDSATTPTVDLAPTASGPVIGGAWSVGSPVEAGRTFVPTPSSLVPTWNAAAGQEDEVPTWAVYLAIAFAVVTAASVVLLLARMRASTRSSQTPPS